MTDEERLMSEVDSFREMILGKLADEALDRGEERLAAGYRWLLEERKWPTIRTHGGRHYCVWFKTYHSSPKDSDVLPDECLPESSATDLPKEEVGLAYFDNLPHALKAAALAYEA